MTGISHRSLHLGQFRLVRLQVVNWGTFCGYKDFPIDERGVLLTGPSGSGKSSLLDAHSLVLLPTIDVRFNASADLTAKGAKRNARSIVDYVRGAWSENDDEHDQSAVQYLRGGEATWSAVAATYDDGMGAVTTAVVVKWFPGVENDPESLRTMHQLHEGHFDLQELNTWAAARFDTAKWKKTCPAFFPKGQERYLEELGRRIGLDHSGTAKTLLAKAKAMKNVGDLNLFIRDNMLDRPPTFDAAEKALASFTPLDDAYRTAKRAHDQEQVLHEVPESWRIYQESEAVRDRAAGLRDVALERYVRCVHLEAINSELDAIDRDIAELAAREGELSQARQDKHDALLSIESQLREKNEGLRELQERQDRRAGEAKFARERYNSYSGHLGRLGEHLPRDEEAFAAVRAHLPEIAAQAERERAELEPVVHDAIGKQFTVKREYESKDAELQRLRSAPTLIPGSAVTRREQIAHGTGVAVSALPFAAELIDVADGQERWRPAAEKVLRNYGMRLLVPEQHGTAVSRFIDEHDMRGLVEYSIVMTASAHEPRPALNTLAGKLTVDLEHHHGRWLVAQLARRFNHVCVEEPRELDEHPMAVTVHGLVKLRGNHYRKDDRAELTNPASWILGANTAAKRRALEAEVATLAEEVQKATSEAAALSERLEHSKSRIASAAEAARFGSWSQLDHWELTRQASDLQQRIASIRDGDHDLQRLEKQRDAAKTEFNKAFADWQRTSDDIEKRSQRQTALADRLQAEQDKPRALAEEDRSYLDELYADVNTTATADNSNQVRKDLDAALRLRESDARGDHDKARERLRSAITRFIEYWPDKAPDTSGDIDRAGADFASLHTEISTRGLPQAMDRLQKLISEDMVHSIAQLLYTVDKTAQDIEKRIGWVNSGLRRVEFNDGTHLQIAFKASPSAEIKEFRSKVDEIMRHAAGRKAHPNEYVKQFHRVKALMARFTGTDNQRWRDAVLDVRRSYTFYGRETGTDGNTVHTYRNAGTQSGGEQEKLVAFCLAAALSYNLGESQTEGRPRFGALMLDEAFSKSDEKFSAQALSAFDEFGFQLLMAAPIRMAGIVEPYIGQAILVHKRSNSDGSRSTGKIATFGELARHQRDRDGDDIHAAA